MLVFPQKFNDVFIFFTESHTSRQHKNKLALNRPPPRQLTPGFLLAHSGNG